MDRVCFRAFGAALAAVHFVACSGGDTTETDVVTDVLPLDPARPPAPAAGSACVTSPEGVTTLERPMFPDRDGSPTFGYSFKQYPGANPDATTIIYLPGGPGQTGIEEMRDPAYGPLEYSFIETDLRGIGCNAPEAADHYPGEFYNSVYFADDVISIIEHLGLEDYVLYGISYGTQLATMVASRLEARGLPLPRALVLEGVLGTAFTTGTPTDYAAFQERWRAVRDSTDESIRSQLLADPPPAGLSSEEWGAGITGALPLGAGPDWANMNFLFVLLQYLSPAAPADVQAQFPTIMRQLGASPVDALGQRLHEEVSCREIDETEFVSLRLDGGELVPSTFDCEDVPLSAAYSASDWPVHAPIYYFSGTDDPNTPPWQARTHFDAQSAAQRQLVHVTGGGHNSLLINLTDCASSLWQAVAAGAGFEPALATCSWPHELESAAASP